MGAPEPRRYLIVANQTLGGEALMEAVRDRAGRGPATFHVLVPATDPGEHAIWTEGEARAVATRRLDETLQRLRALDVDPTGEVGDEDPLGAIGDVLRERSFDEVILSTLPPGISRWLRQDLPHRVQRAYDVPVTHVVAEVPRKGE